MSYKTLRRLALTGLCASMFVLGCKDGGPSSPPFEILPSDEALFVSIDGNTPGIWILKADSLKFIDSVRTGTGVPFTLEFSSDYSQWYSVWAERIAPYVYLSKLNCVDTHSKAILNSVDLHTPAGYLVTDKDSRFLITYPYGLEFINKSTLAEVKLDTAVGYASDVVPSKRQRALFIALTDSNGFKGICVYDLDSFKVVRIIPVADYATQSAMMPKSLAISPDEQYAYLSAFTEQGFGGVNWFLAVRLADGHVVDRYTCGAFAQLTVSPDGNYVYLSDPAGYMYGFPPIHKILRYDVYSGQMETFLDQFVGSDFRSDIETTDKIVISSSGRTMFISSDGSLGASNGKQIAIAKIDIPTRRVITTFSWPVDSRGYITFTATNITLGKYSGLK